MRRIFSFLLLCVYMFSMTEMHQLVKAPMLVEHYLEHKEEDKSISLVSFLEMHYLNGFTKDADFEKDMKLPFKSIGDTCYSYIVVIPNAFVEIPQRVEISLNKNTKGVIQKSQTFISNYFSSIWQPPKIA